MFFPAGRWTLNFVTRFRQVVLTPYLKLLSKEFVVYALFTTDTLTFIRILKIGFQILPSFDV